MQYMQSGQCHAGDSQIAEEGLGLSQTGSQAHSPEVEASANFACNAAHVYVTPAKHVISQHSQGCQAMSMNCNMPSVRPH